LIVKVPPSFNEVRHTLNLAQVMASASELEMICFDGDQTLYSDGGNFSYAPLAAIICMLLENDVKVVIITAAGYGYDCEKYEVRLRGLLDAFLDNAMSLEVMGRFYVLGGECNYLLRCGADARLNPVPDADWSVSGPKPRCWDDKECQYLLDVAEKSLRDSMSDLKLRAKILRKPRGIGLMPGGRESISDVPSGHGSIKLKKEALDEVVLRAQHSLKVAKPPISLPFCAFNGGADAWIDVGNKCIGVEAMQAYLGVTKSRSLHVGDQFLKTGNDVAARACSPCIWITSPVETLKVLEILLGLMGLDSKRKHPPPQTKLTKTVSSPKMAGSTSGSYSFSFPELAIPSNKPILSQAVSEPMPLFPPDAAMERAASDPLEF
jgi:IMP and pyridine-specific 5'-nucleotidase